MANRLNKTVTKFIIDMQYGLSRGKSCLISEIARSLEEKIDLKNTIERLCDNLVGMKEPRNKTNRKELSK